MEFLTLYSELIKKLAIPFCFIFIAISIWQTTHHDDHFEIDSPGYHRVAVHFANTGIPLDPETPDEMLEHTVGYHIFLGSIYTFFGTAPFFAIAAQCLLALCIFLFLLHITLLLSPGAPPFLALLLAGLNVGIITYSQYIHADILLLSFLTSFTYFFLYYLNYNERYSLSALSLGLSILVRPAGLFFGFFLPFFMIARKRSLEGIKEAAVFTLLLSTPLIAYMSYNSYRYNQFRLTSLVQENIYNYFLPRHVLPRLSLEEQKIIKKDLDGLKAYEKKSKIFKKLLYEHPFLCIIGWVSSTMRTFFGLYSTQLKVLYNPSIKGGECSFFFMSGTIFQKAWRYISYGSAFPLLTAISLFEAAYLLFLYFFVFFGLAQLLIRRWYSQAIFLLIYLINFAGVTGHGAHARYRLMLEPALIPLAVLGLYYVYQAVCNNRRNAVNLKLS